MSEEIKENGVRSFFLAAVDYDKERTPCAVKSDDVVGLRPGNRNPNLTVVSVAGPERHVIVHAHYSRVRALFVENGYRFLDPR